ncbi:unnamed protein product [Brassica rapa]|uniref:Thioredoxin domain-containing protein n=2 Tax=Brassica TaxID=3705 RepID=A0A8D9CSB8_BRACM|nr:unnamed protein product [Brassica napus]CAG7862339.1 unnamed protein product [Brassica rapa]
MSDQAKKFLPSDSPAFENFNEMVKAESGEMMGGAVKDITSKSELDNLRQSGAPIALHFWASWCDA